ncbi:hypothetical protein CCO03_15270 [Comamonas serinivorans]|uniref:Uncharacterized protein n=1 Tax=Comamonas serinivorans TaxID=1082851 RepID=A0A1Y0EQC5_9BURK|nr:hypothetical protein CCO03_15270 [Comamonas serinivorans]
MPIMPIRVGCFTVRSRVAGNAQGYWTSGGIGRTLRIRLLSSRTSATSTRWPMIFRVAAWATVHAGEANVFVSREAMVTTALPATIAARGLAVLEHVGQGRLAARSRCAVQVAGCGLATAFRAGLGALGTRPSSASGVSRVRPAACMETRQAGHAAL